MSPYLVIIPSYNEIENIHAILNSVMNLAIGCDALVVDDGSPDGTARAVEELILKFPQRIHLLERKEKTGLGRAYIDGFKWALSKDYLYISEMDADFSHPPAKLEELFYACASNKTDVSIGSRYIKGGGVINWPLSRLLLSRGASMYVRMITGMNIKDPTAGFVCYSRKVLEQIDLDKINFVGYAFQIEMKYIVHIMKFRMLEIPIQFPDRIRGKSKMNIFIIREALTGVFTLRFLKSKKDYFKN